MDADEPRATLGDAGLAGSALKSMGLRYKDL